MAQDDIYRLSVHYEGPTSVASVAIYYQENALVTGLAGPTRALNESFQFARLSEMRAVLAEDWQISSTQAEKITGAKQAMDLFSLSTGPGTVTGDSLPANNAIVLQLYQAIHPRVSNGRWFLPGVPESATDAGRLTQAFTSGPLSDLANKIDDELAESGGAGSWVPGVVSAKIRDANLPAKDWESAFSPLVGAAGWPIIGRQVRRSSKVRGIPS